MKRYLILFFLTALSLASFSQGYVPFKTFEIGLGISQNSVVGDAETIRRTYSPSFSLTYNPGLYNAIVAEAQLGNLQGGDLTKDYSGRQFKNKFYSGSLRLQCQLGILLGESDNFLLSAISNVYLGSGLGAIRNNMTAINRTSLYFEDYYTGGYNRSYNLMVPFRVGYDLKVLNYYSEVLCRIDIAYQYNRMLGDDIDGFKAGIYKDILSQFSLGIKFGVSGRKKAY